MCSALRTKVGVRVGAGETKLRVEEAALCSHRRLCLANLQSGCLCEAGTTFFLRHFFLRRKNCWRGPIKKRGPGREMQLYLYPRRAPAVHVTGADL